MTEKVAVATMQGKPYFLIVNQLREQNIPFISIVRLWMAVISETGL